MNLLNPSHFRMRIVDFAAQREALKPSQAVLDSRKEKAAEQIALLGEKHLLAKPVERKQ